MRAAKTKDALGVKVGPAEPSQQPVVEVKTLDPTERDWGPLTSKEEKGFLPEEATGLLVLLRRALLRTRRFCSAPCQMVAAGHWK